MYMSKASGGGGQMKGVRCKNPRCDQELLCVNNEDLYCSRECYSIKTEREQIQTSDVKFKRKGLIGRGGTGLLKDPSTVDRLVICADNQYGRIVTVKKGSVGFIQKKAKKTKGQPLDPEEILRKQKKKDDKKRLRELLNVDVEDSSEETTSSNEDDLDEIESSPVNSLICPPHPPLSSAEGKLLKAYVINVVSPWEIYIQTGKMISKTEEINDICNSIDGIDPRLIEDNWFPRVGGFCCAKFEDKLNRVKILERSSGNKFKVVYIDYGNKELVPASDLHQLNPEVTLIPAQCIPFRVSNVKPHLNQTGTADWNQEVIKFTIANLEGAVVGLHFDAVECNEIHVGTLSVVSSLSGLIKGDFGEALVMRNMADPDSYYLDQLKHVHL